MNPIPVCNSTDMGWIDPTCPEGWEFPPRASGLHGTGEDVTKPGEPAFSWTLMDEVEVPADLEEGDYVLSFRWECEATPQIWNSSEMTEFYLIMYVSSYTDLKTVYRLKAELRS